MVSSLVQAARLEHVFILEIRLNIDIIEAALLFLS